MPTLRNVSPRGDLDIPLLRRVVRRGEQFECSAEQAARLLEQPDNFAAVKPARSSSTSSSRRSSGGKGRGRSSGRSADTTSTSEDGASA